MGCDAAGVNRDALVTMASATPIPFDDMAAYSLAGLKALTNFARTESKIPEMVVSSKKYPESTRHIKDA